MRIKPGCLALIVVCAVAVVANAQTDHVRAATDLLSGGYLSQAEAEAHKAERNPATRALALATLGAIRLQQGKLDEGKKFLVQALALNPKLVGARTNLGNAYALNNQPDRAERCFREVLRLAPDNFNARFNLFKIEAARGEFQQSLELAKPILPNLLASDEGLVVLASDYGALGKKEEINALVNNWLQLPAPSSDTTFDFVTTLLLYDRKTDATAILEDMEQRLKARPEPDAALKLANAFLTLGAFDHAESNATLALSQRLDCAACYQTLAQIAARQNDSEKALSLLVTARKLAPQDPEVLFEFGSVCLERNLLEDALPALSRAAELRPDNDSYVYALGSANVGKGRLPDALGLFQKLLEKHPKDAGLLYAIGAVYYLQSKFPEAEASLQQSVAAHPGHVPATYYLALTYDAMGEEDRAIELFRSLLSTSPQHVPTYVKLGGILVRRHQYEEAQRNLEKALSLDPHSVEAHYQLGLALRRLGKASESEAQFAESHRLETEQSAQRDLRLRLLLPE
jgi:tetratricopeptide (TPR) repeat protein